MFTYPIGLLNPKTGDLSFRFTINTALDTGDNIQLPFTDSGVFNCVVDWGDSSSDVITTWNQAETLHAYSGAFSGQVTITGTAPGFAFNNGGDKLKITSVDNWGDVGFVNLSGGFRGCTNLLTIDAGILTYGGTSLSNFVNGCTSLTLLDASNWDVSSVTTFSTFAFLCSSLTTLNVSGWDTSNVNSFINFATSCSSLITLDVSGWDTSSVTVFTNFVAFCSSLITLDVSGWDTALVTTFSTFARGCTLLVTLDTDNWDTSSVTICTNMARSCTSLTSSFLNTLWWDRTIPITTFTNCFASSTNISNYASIPSAWGGGGA